MSGRNAGEMMTMTTAPTATAQATGHAARNSSIDLLRFVFASTAILNHCHALWDIHPNLYYVVCEFLARCTVPYFLCIAGYYYCKALFAGRPVYRKQLRSMLKLYGVWTVVYYGCSFVMNVLLGGEALLPFLRDRVLFFFTVGSYPHMWYFPAMIYAMTVFALVHRLFGRRGLAVYSAVCVALHLVGALGAAYLPLGQGIPLLSALYAQPWFNAASGILSMGFPGFAAGYWVYRLGEKGWLTPRNTRRALLAAGLLFAAESAALLVLGWVETPFVSVSCLYFPAALFAFLLLRPMPRRERLSWYARRQAIAIFCVHPLLLIVLRTAMGLVGLEIADTLVFVLVYLASLVFGFAVIKLGGRTSRLLLGL